MKLEKISLSELATAEINEREMARVLGGGEPGCCQCGCNYANQGGSTTSSNDSANNAEGLTSDPGATTPCDGETTDDTTPIDEVDSTGHDMPPLCDYAQDTSCLPQTLWC